MHKDRKARLAIDRACYQGEADNGNLNFDLGESELRDMITVCTILLAKLKKLNSGVSVQS
jgi:hypothetical protein